MILAALIIAVLAYAAWCWHTVERMWRDHEDEA
jgi:hypothetical protein